MISEYDPFSFASRYKNFSLDTLFAIWASESDTTTKHIHECEITENMTYAEYITSKYRTKQAGFEDATEDEIEMRLEKIRRVKILKQDEYYHRFCYFALRQDDRGLQMIWLKEGKIDSCRFDLKGAELPDVMLTYKNKEKKRTPSFEHAFTLITGTKFKTLSSIEKALVSFKKEAIKISAKDAEELVEAE